MNDSAQALPVTAARTSEHHQGARARLTHALALVRRIIGVPDYDTYVRHMAACHPGQAPLSARDFDEERMTAKYSKPGQRCC